MLQELLLAYGLMSYVYPSAINSQLHVNLPFPVRFEWMDTPFGGVLICPTFWSILFFTFFLHWKLIHTELKSKVTFLENKSLRENSHAIHR